jgi:preprotein translocase subunit YajC
MNLYSLNVILAQAAAPVAATQPNPTGQFLQTGGFMVLMLVMLYFVMIRPQSKKAKEHATMLQGLRPGDKVVTSGGVVGTVVSVKERTIALRSAETKLEILKSAISDVTERGESSSPTES